jgi:hypothetical protein
VAFFAQTATDPLLGLVNLGVLGMLAYAFVSGLIEARPTIRRLVDQQDAQIARLLKEREEIHKLLSVQVSALGTEMSRLVAETEELLHMIESLAIRQQRQ